MIEEVTSTTKLAPANLLRDLVLDGSHPFACWQMPGTGQLKLLVSIQKPLKVNAGFRECGPGFVVNSFNDNHPVEPTLIPADIVIEQDGTFRTDHQMSQEQVDLFLQDLREKSRTSIEKDQSFPPKSCGGTSDHAFTDTVKQAIDLIRSSDLDKVVLSRFEDIPIDPSFDIGAFFDRLTKAYKSAFCNIWSLGDGTVWVGASPETLVSQEAETFETISLAGTQPLKEQSIQDISWRQKEIEEQALVSRYIINCFKKLRIREFKERGPKTIAAGSLAHLITTYTVNVEEIRFPELVDEMTELLHPTSAVCGMPIQEAKRFIEAKEGYQREYYAGFIGPVNMNEKTHLFVNLRCMKFEKNTARIYAGAGITEDSDPEQEYRETQLKMEILKSQLEL